MSLYAKFKETAIEGAIFGLAPLVTSLTGFALTFVYAAFFAPADLGHLALLLGTEAFASQLLGVGMTQAYFRSYFDDDGEERRRRITSTTLWFLVAVNVLFVVAAWPFAGWYASLLGIPGASYVQLTILLIALDTINNVPFLVLKATKRSKQFVAVKWIAGLVQFGVIVALVAFWHLGLFGALVGWVVGTGLQTIIYVWMLRGEVALEFSVAELRPLLALGAPMIANPIATKILIVADRFFINHYAGANAVGLYEMANKLASVLPVLITQPFSYIWPAMRFQVMRDDDADEYYARVLTYLTFLSCYFGLGVSLVAPDFLLIAIREAYWGAGAVVPLFALYYLLVATGKGVNVGLMTEKKAYWNVLIVVSAAGANVALNFLLIPRYGIVGAGWATVLSYAFMNWFRWFMSTRYHPIDYEWGRLAKLAGVAMAFYAVLWWLPITNPYVSIVVRGLGASLYPVALVFVGFYDRREIGRLRELRAAGVARAKRLALRRTSCESVADPAAFEAIERMRESDDR
jgi:O-antigen/teichoic acid export membrane protein